MNSKDVFRYLWLASIVIIISFSTTYTTSAYGNYGDSSYGNGTYNVGQASPSPTTTTNASSISGGSSMSATARQAYLKQIYAQNNKICPPELCPPDQNKTIPQVTTSNINRVYFDKDLRRGDVNSKVKDLQVLLNSLGYIVNSTGIGSPGYETNIFGAKTYSALMKYQNANGIPTTGFFGPITRSSINSRLMTSNNSGISTTSSIHTFSKKLSLGIKDNEVLYLQQYLNGHGYRLANSGPGSPENETNYFGTLTKQALMKMQLTNSLENSAGLFDEASIEFVNSH